MNDKEKLRELIDRFDVKNSPIYGFRHYLADHLLANGVVVREWIPVTERLPEKNTAVIAATDIGIVFQCLYAYDGWDLWEGNEVNITHWMPLPAPPMRKGENG